MQVNRESKFPTPLFAQKRPIRTRRNTNPVLATTEEEADTTVVSETDEEVDDAVPLTTIVPFVMVVPFVAPPGGEPPGKVPLPPGPPLPPPPPIPLLAFATPPSEVSVAAPVNDCCEVRSTPNEIQAKMPSATESLRREYSTMGSWPLALSCEKMLSSELVVRSWVLTE